MKRRRFSLISKIFSVILAWALALSSGFIWVVPAQANGGTIAVSGDKGPFNVTLIYSPSPPSPTVPLHLTMTVTKASSDNPVNSATVLATPAMPGMAMPGATPVRFVQAPARPNMYDADVPVGMEGLWSLTVQIIDPQLGQTSFDVSFKVEKPSAPWGVIIGILVALPALAGLTWWLLFRDKNATESDDE